MSKEKTGDVAGAKASGAAAGPEAAHTTKKPREKKIPSHPAFVGKIFPAPLDENGVEQEGVGPGSAHFLACVYQYDKSQETSKENVHSKVDKVFGQPFFVAFIYPNPNLRDEELDVDEVLAGGGGGHAAMGGVEGDLIYIGKFHSLIPVEQKAGTDAVSPPTAPPSPAPGSSPSGGQQG